MNTDKHGCRKGMGANECGFDGHHSVGRGSRVLQKFLSVFIRVHPWLKASSTASFGPEEREIHQSLSEICMSWLASTAADRTLRPDTPRTWQNGSPSPRGRGPG